MLVNTKPRKYGLSHNILWSRRLCIKFFRAIIKIRIHKSFIRDQWYHLVTYTHRCISEVLRCWRDQSLGLLCRFLAPNATHRFHNIMQIGKAAPEIYVSALSLKLKDKTSGGTWRPKAKHKPEHHPSRKLLLPVDLVGVRGGSSLRAFASTHIHS